MGPVINEGRSGSPDWARELISAFYGAGCDELILGSMVPEVDQVECLKDIV